MPRYLRSLWAWLREQLDPTLPPPELRPPVDRATPPPCRAAVYDRCPGCGWLHERGKPHPCRDLGGEA